MSAEQGWYYLHVDGSLHFKRELGDTAADLRESDLVQQLWALDTRNRENAWRILIEATALGANADRVAELARHWRCDDEDAQLFAKYVGIRLFRDGESWGATRADFVNLAESPAGFGKTALEAFAALAVELGYRGGKTWGPSFADLATRPLIAGSSGTVTS